jgi:creatinine amidohydrolase/Fe(II)-dependent formamide hydrolase-like protein
VVASGHLTRERRPAFRAGLEPADNRPRPWIAHAGTASGRWGAAPMSECADSGQDPVAHIVRRVKRSVRMKHETATSWALKP